ncbi:DUF3828 domain-containing protein [Dyella mobilis]|uniref:DUF3828 domain-containing protein n=1 Tax=Dyella mobilis TaxID=1849582 RepID=A0ABS2KN65_9GAMM|nr:DUF3828 domain-containing protein [Dyella mobilis]MBM7132409.1 DUF3828 domain-containing protein [Dyella mobilis]GLQ95603.1 hypothetical protein GCM10007863_00210 [Dyella mobilis]
MKRLASMLVVVLLMTVGLLPARLQAQQAPATPEAAVASFYQWFFKHDNDNTYPLREKDIYSFVSQKTVDRLKDVYNRAGPPHDVDYFLKVQDYDPKDWAANVVVHPSTTLGDVVVVPVTFGSKDKISVLVFLRKQDGRWKITKVDDTWDYE